MLQVALLIKPAIYRLAIIDKRYLKSPSELEWEAISVLVEELKIYYEVTKKLIGTKYPTINLFFVEYCEVYLAIKKMSTSAYPFVVEMGKKMETTFENYWKIGNALLALACVFDPRCKLGVVQHYLKKLYPTEHDELVSNVKCCMNALFQEYEGNHVGSEGQTQADTSNSSMTSASVTNTRAGLKDFIRGMKNSDPKKLELEDYLSSPLDEASLDEVFDILAWWKLKVPRYSVLSRLARDILVVPISTLASESAFSNSGRTLSSVRSCLSDESIEALLCAQDWLRASIDESGGQFGDTIWVTDEDIDS